MKLQQVIAGTDICGAGEAILGVNATGVSCDTRSMSEGELFFAVAPEFAAEAWSKGALAVVLDQNAPCPPSLPADHCLRSADIRLAMALAAANFFGRPAHRLTMLGVTGTNGKTTVSLLVESIPHPQGLG